MSGEINGDVIDLITIDGPSPTTPVVLVGTSSPPNNGVFSTFATMIVFRMPAGQPFSVVSSRHIVVNTTGRRV